MKRAQSLSLNSLKDLPKESLEQLRAATAFLLEEPKQAPEEIEYAYIALGERLLVPPPAFHVFCRHFLYQRLLRSIADLQPFCRQMQIRDEAHAQLRFWRLAMRLLTEDLENKKIQVNLATGIAYMPGIPSLFLKAFPGIGNNSVREQILRTA